MLMLERYSNSLISKLHNSKEGPHTKLVLQLSTVACRLQCLDPNCIVISTRRMVNILVFQKCCRTLLACSEEQLQQHVLHFRFSSS